MHLSDERAPAVAADASRATIRLLTPDDSIADLTRLLHRAYAKLADLGFRFVACDQSDDRTRQRIEGAECYVAVAGAELIIGTITFRRPGTANVIPATPAW